MKVLLNFKHDGVFYACGESAPKLEADVMKVLKGKGLIGEEPTGKERTVLKFDEKMEQGAKIKKIHAKKAAGRKVAKKATK